MDEYANLAESIYTSAWLRLGDVPIWYFHDHARDAHKGDRGTFAPLLGLPSLRQDCVS